jgi:hypothetical protein
MTESTPAKIAASGPIHVFCRGRGSRRLLDTSELLEIAIVTAGRIWAVHRLED